MHNQNPTKTLAWKRLQQLSSEKQELQLKQLFDQDPKRVDNFSLTLGDLYVDYSKNLVDAPVMDALYQLAHETGLQENIDAQYNGQKINATEGRAVMHTALRSLDQDNSFTTEVQEKKARFYAFAKAVTEGSYRGYTDKRIKTVVNIGIGGSDLGPDMIYRALAGYRKDIEVRFVSNVDGDHVMEQLKGLDHETTLFVVVSKSFGTQETLSNAITIRDWFAQQADTKAVAQHFVAVSSNENKVVDFGIREEKIFPMWDWVGGRFSLWSSVGLSVAIAIGTDQFEQLLRGAHEMDTHFQQTDMHDNIPTTLALLDIWYNNFMGCTSQAVIPYTQYLDRLPAYLQQAMMESNGKQVDRDGEPVDYPTGYVVWGEPGTNSQHAFFQLLHQGTQSIPCTFIGFRKPVHGNKEHHDMLMANFVAQTEALMNGKSTPEVISECIQAGMDGDAIKMIAPFKVFDGNRPTTSILMDQVTPYSVGKLVALYEHIIFVQGSIWNIYSYDQWGVQLGKVLADITLKDIKEGIQHEHDPSTERLLEQLTQG